MCLSSTFTQEQLAQHLPDGEEFIAYKSVNRSANTGKARLVSPVYSYEWAPGVLTSEGHGTDAGFYLCLVKPGIQIKESDRDRSRRILKFKVRREDILKGGPDTIFGHTCVCVVVRRVELLKEDFEIALGEDEQVFMTEALAIAGDTPDKIPKLAEERKVETDAAVSKVEETAEKEREAREAENARSKEIQRETDAKAESTASAVKKTARKTAATRKAVKTAVKKSKMALGKSGATAVKKAAASKKKAAAKDATAIKKKVKAATKGAKKVTKAPAKKTPVKKSGAKKPARFGRYDDMSTEDLRTAAKVMGVKGTVKMDRVALLKALKKLA